MKERQESQYLIPLPILSSLPTQMSLFSNFYHQDIAHNIRMAQHNALWMTCRPRTIHQKRQVLTWIDLDLPKSRRTRNIPHIREMLKSSCLVPLIANQDNPVLINPHSLTGFNGILQERFLRRQRLSSRVLKLEGQLISSISWVRRR